MLPLQSLQVEVCFDECISGFRSKKLTSAEKECVTKCATKFTGFTQRVASRFQELQIKLQQVRLSFCGCRGVLVDVHVNCNLRELVETHGDNASGGVAASVAAAAPASHRCRRRSDHSMSAAHECMCHGLRLCFVAPPRAGAGRVVARGAVIRVRARSAQLN